MNSRADGARIIITDWIRAKREELLYFITDENHIEDAEAFELAAYRFGAVPKIGFLSSDSIQKGKELEEMKEIMSYSDAIIGATHFSFVTTGAVHYAISKGSRFLSFPMHTNDGSSIFCTNFIKMDPKRAYQRGEPIKKLLDKAKCARVTTAAGTDLRFRLDGRRAGIFNGVCDRRKKMSSSSFEVYTSMIESSTTGSLVVDASLGYLGLPKKKLHIEFRHGYAVHIEDSEDGKRLDAYMKGFGDKGIYVAAEFGIGLNELSECLGISYIEDESKYGTFHIGMGRNIALGGKHEAKGHFDLVFDKPNLYLDDVLVIQEGNIPYPFRKY